MRTRIPILCSVLFGLAGSVAAADGIRNVLLIGHEAKAAAAQP